MASDGKPPAQATCMWAQRHDHLIFTIKVEGCAKPDIKLTPEKLDFTGVCKSGKTDQSYHLELDFYENVDPEKTVIPKPLSSRFIELIIRKKKEIYWPRLIKEKGKVNWISVNFDKWKDEDESDDEDAASGKGQDMEQLMAQMGGMGGFGGGGSGGMPPGMGGMGEMPGMDGGDFNGLDGDDDEEDSDDENLPELE